MSPACPRRTPKIIEKLSHNFAATLNFLLVGRSSGLNADLALVPDRNAIGARRFLCHGIRSLTGCVRTAIPLTGQCLDELDSDFDPARQHRHIEPLPLNLDLLCMGGAIALVDEKLSRLY